MDPVKATAAIPMQLVDAGKAKMLVCRLEKPVPAGAQLVLRRAGDDYELVVVQTTGDRPEPATLASFVAPEDADANEAIHAVAIAHETRGTAPKTRRPAQAHRQRHRSDQR